MNNSSSRSHAIFTIIIEQHIIEDLINKDGSSGGATKDNEGAE